MRRRDWDPVPVGAVLGDMIAAGGWRGRLAVGRLKTNWAGVVGDQIAGHCIPVRLADGVLTIRADSGVWATELTLLSRRLVDTTDRWLGGGLVREVKIYAGKG